MDGMQGNGVAQWKEWKPVGRWRLVAGKSERGWWNVDGGNIQSDL